MQSIAAATARVAAVSSAVALATSSTASTTFLAALFATSRRTAAASYSGGTARAPGLSAADSAAEFSSKPDAATSLSTAS